MAGDLDMVFIKKGILSGESFKSNNIKESKMIGIGLIVLGAVFSGLAAHFIVKRRRTRSAK